MEIREKSFFISDMYFSVKQIEGLLDACYIKHYHGIIVSSEAGYEKWPEGDLFKYMMNMHGLRCEQILHIGDNWAADVKSAEKCGINTFYIWNARKMLECSYLRKILVNVKSIEDKVIVGMYMAKALNDPFALSREKGRLYIASKELLGYIGYGGLLTAYLHWLLKKYTSNEIDKVLFLARDGYLPERMYQKIVKERKIEKAPKGLYVLSSRRCLAGAAIYNEQDLLQQVERINSAIPAGQILEARYGVILEKEDAKSKEVLIGNELKEYLMSYKEKIICESAKERNNFLRYLNTLGISYENERDILFDSLTSGTSAYYYRKITKADAKLVCLVCLNVPEYSLYNQSDEAFLGEDTSYFEQKGYTKCVYLGDCIFTSPKEQLIKFDDDGIPVFAVNKKEGCIETIEETHKGIEAFITDYIKLTPYSIKKQEITADLVDCLVGMFAYGYYIVNEEWKDQFSQCDTFADGKGEPKKFFK